MLYMVSIKSPNAAHKAEAEDLIAFKKGIEAAIAKGVVKGAYTKVGGGTVMIVDSPGNGQLTHELRKHFITDAEVVPLVSFLDVLDEHIKFKNHG